jgi:hypothetical protein
MRWVVVLLVAVVVALAPREASAFCGFYVGGAGAKLTNGATVVVLMRDGTHTVLSMQNHYAGPPEAFAMVVPVPVVLAKENVRTLPREVFDRIDTLAAPRLVEYWEQDPCGEMPGIGLGNIGTMGYGVGHGRLSGAFTQDLGVKVEAQFAVAEYQIVILSAEDAAGLETWLHREGYSIPEGAADVLRPYVAAGTKFFVAKVDPAKVTFEHGAAMLSPLRFDYDSPAFSLPVRLGLLNSGGVQDLVIHVLASQRYEVANYPNVSVPTNLDVPDSAREDFAATYADIFDRTLAANPRAVVTEYAWSPGSCDPCPGGAAGGGLTGADFATLGGDVAPSLAGATGGSGSPTLTPARVEVTGPLPAEAVQRIVRQNFGRIRLCYEKGLGKNPGLKGHVELGFSITPKGETSAVAMKGSDLADADALECIHRGMMRLSFPEAPAPTKARYGVDLATGGPVLSRAASRWVLTRLHARYTKDALGEDLVFRPAPPITGGREMREEDGGLEQGAQPASTDNFQARYAIRHPWTGPIACDSPHRGIWGGKPGGGPVQTFAARNVAFAQRGTSTPPALPPSTKPPADASPDAGAPSTPSARRGCGGCTLTRDPSPVSWWLALPALFRLRARRTRRRGSAPDR